MIHWRYSVPLIGKMCVIPCTEDFDQMDSFFVETPNNAFKLVITIWIGYLCCVYLTLFGWRFQIVLCLQRNLRWWSPMTYMLQMCWNHKRTYCVALMSHISAEHVCVFCATPLLDSHSIFCCWITIRFLYVSPLVMASPFCCKLSCSSVFLGRPWIATLIMQTTRIKFAIHGMYITPS